MPIDPDVYPLARRLDDLREALADRLSATEAHILTECVGMALDLQTALDAAIGYPPHKP